MAHGSPAKQTGLERWARFAHRNRGKVILTWFLALVVLVALETQLGGEMNGTFTLPGSESQRAIDLLEARSPQRAGDVADLVFEAPAGLAEPAVRARIEALNEQVRALPGVAAVESPYDDPSFIAQGGTIGRGLVRWTELGDNIPVSDIKDFVKIVEEANGSGLTVEPGGDVVFFAEQPAFGSEAFGVLAAVIILFIAFGTVLAVGLPIAAALFGIGAGTAIVALLAHFIGFPDFTTQFMAMIGIGVGIDYSLLVVTRFREGLHHGLNVEDAVAMALGTAGRAVIFAGTVVAIAFMGLYAMGLPPIAALATGSAIVVAMAVLVAITLMPALLSLIGTRIDRWHVPFLHTKEGVDTSSGWYRLSKGIQKRPLPYFVGAVIFLLVLAFPVLDMRLGFNDAGNGTTSRHTRRAYDLLARGFGPGYNGAITVVIDQGRGAASVDKVRETLIATDNVASVGPPFVSPAGDTAILTVYPKTSPQAAESAALVNRLRDDALPTVLRGTNAAAYVTGFPAVSVDIQQRMQERLPYLFIGVIGLSFILLMTVFRSVLVAAKAAIMNLLSIGAAYGVVVAVFQWGWGNNLVGVDKGPIEPFLPMMFFAILFGLSMDYEVFLISRIREIYVKSGNSGDAVAEGLAATARVITAAAAIMVAVFLAFVLGDDRTVKMIGLGLATAIFVDATVVRLILVPATMELLGNANWWMPRWLDRVLPNIHVEAPVTMPERLGAPGGGGQ